MAIGGHALKDLRASLRGEVLQRHDSAYDTTRRVEAAICFPLYFGETLGSRGTDTKGDARALSMNAAFAL